jgi:hypothetical protein
MYFTNVIDPEVLLHITIKYWTDESLMFSPVPMAKYQSHCHTCCASSSLTVPSSDFDSYPMTQVLNF